MKKIKFLRQSLVAVVALLYASGPANADLILNFQPYSQDVALGDPVVVDLVISGLGDLEAPSLGGFDIDVTFDPSVLALDTTDADFDFVIDSVTLDPTNQLDIWGFGLNPVSSDVTVPGTLNLFDLSLDFPSDLIDFQLDSFSLATITFNTLGPGSSGLGFSKVILSDELGGGLQATLNGGIVNVAPIPEPSSLLLISTGLAGLVALRKRKKAKKE